MDKIKRFFSNVYVRAFLIVIITAIAGDFYMWVKGINEKSEASTDNSKNIHDQMWDLFHDQGGKNDKVQRQIHELDSIVKSKCK